MPTTPNHDYNVPNEGAQDWHIPLNENFKQYDTDIEIRDVSGNRNGYDPKQGAKFFATDTGQIYFGDGGTWNRLGSSGSNPTFGEVRAARVGLGHAPFGDGRITARLNSGEGSVIDAETSSGENTATGVFAEASSSSGNTFGTYSVSRSPDGHGVFGVNFASSGTAIGVEGSAQSPDGVGVLASNSSGTALHSAGNCVIAGDLDVSGTKNFTQTVDTPDGEQEVVYTATEAGTPHTECSGVVELEDGRAEIDLPEHFAWVTSSDEPIHVQTTPYSAESGGLAVVERSPDRLVIEDRRGIGDYELSYTVKGTRDGYADQEVVREPRESVPVSLGSSQVAEEEPGAAD